MKKKVLWILGALCLQYAADFTFLYLNSRGMWVSGGVNDLMYLVGYFVMAIALIQFNSGIDR